MVDYKDDNPLPPPLEDLPQNDSRRNFIAKGALAVAGLAAGGAALSPLFNAEEIPSIDELLQKHYKRLTDDDKKDIFARLEAQI